jgi:hypothetical protein
MSIGWFIGGGLCTVLGANHVFGASAGMTKDEQNQFIMYFGLAFVGISYIVAEVGASTFINRWNKKLKKDIGLDVASVNYSPMNVAIRTSSFCQISEKTLQVPLFQTDF